MDKVAIGYSGGVDSTLLAKAATDALGEQSLCILVDSPLTPTSEIDEAIALADEFGFNLLRLQVNALEFDGVADNSPDRCYFCKRAIFSKIIAVAKERGLQWVLDGSNADDDSDYRPGARAINELGVRSPLKELGFTKERVRAISRQIGLPTWSKPSYACLASRIPYGTPLTPDVLKRVEDAETVLRRTGFRLFRVRHHGNVARIEVMPLEMEKLLNPAVREHVLSEFKALGYRYVTLDLAGYRTGSMNETLELDNTDE